MLILVLHEDEVLVNNLNDDITFPSIEQLQSLKEYIELVSETNDEYIGYVATSTNKEFIENNSTLKFINLRGVLALLPESHIKKAVYYKSLIHYYKQKFCSICSNTLAKQQHNKFLYCNKCEHEIYPHIAPSIIVRIHRGDEILLARNINFANNIWSLLAGYVEIGETLEETVEREVFEEVGIKVKNIKYWGSEPWPFPGSTLMLGFTAEYASGEFNLQTDEIVEAGFFTKNNLPGYPSSKASIAYKMINEFILKNSQ